MTDSNIEPLLKQMTLAEPSQALDDRIDDCLQKSSVVVPAEVRQSRSTGIVTAVAVASLLLGIAIGRMTTVAQSNVVSGNRNTAQAPVPGSNSDSDKSDWTSWGTSDSTSLAMGLSRLSDDAVNSHLRGPKVGVLCALGTMPVPDSSEERCLQCHDGVKAATDQFREYHSQQLKDDSCTLCHDMNAGPPGHTPDQTHGLFRGHEIHGGLVIQNCRSCHSTAVKTCEGIHLKKSHGCSTCHRVVDGSVTIAGLLFRSMI